MSFNEISFRGENALASMVDTSTTPTHPPIATIPIKKCSVSDEITRCSAYSGLLCAGTREPTSDTWGTHKELDLS